MAVKFEQLDRMFHPRRVAVLGVSGEGVGFGRTIVNSLISIGFEGKIYPVNPKGGSVFGIPLLPSVEAIPEDIDFAIIAVPAPAVPDALEACRKKGAAGAEVLSSGFEEAGTEKGEELNRRLKEVIDRGIRVLGPNCFGIYCPRSGLTMLPGPDFSRETGPVALLSQSGGLSADFISLGKWRGFAFSKAVSFGNGCDLRETEMLQYLRRDPDTGIICMYMEGVLDGREFFRTLRETALEKPVIILKGGLSESGSRAVQSHTASLGGSQRIWRAALAQCNVVQVETLTEMADAALAFSKLPHRVYGGAALVGGGGAIGVHGADMAEKAGLATPALPADLRKEIEAVLPQPGSSAANPIDIANPFTGPDVIKKAIVLASRDPAIDLHLLTQLVYHYNSLLGLLGAGSIKDIVPWRALCRACSEAVAETGKPVVLALPNNKQELAALEIEELIREARQGFLDAGIPVYAEVRDALSAVSALSRYAARREAIRASMEEAS